MNIAIILASGESSRFNGDIPKQYIKLKNKMILCYSIDTFLDNKEIDFVIVVYNEKHNKFIECVKKNYISDKKIFFCFGGETRLQSFLKAMKFIENNISSSDINKIITHDSARPLISNHLINNHINQLNQFDFINTIFNIKDTIIEIENDKVLSYPNRDNFFLVQTPQSFNYSIYNKIDFNFKNETINDLSKIFYLNKIKIKNVMGNIENWKITSNEDLKLIKYFLDTK